MKYSTHNENERFEYCFHEHSLNFAKLIFTDFHKTYLMATILEVINLTKTYDNGVSMR